MGSGAKLYNMTNGLLIYGSSDTLLRLTSPSSYMTLQPIP